MINVNETDNGRDIYKKFIDDLVEDEINVSAKLIEEQGIYAKDDELHSLNDFVSRLNEVDRDILIKMLKEERKNVTHDILATLTWLIDCYDVTICHKGKEMPVQLSGMGLHGDYIGRIQGWEWPVEE